MPTKAHDLFDDITSFSALLTASQRAAKGKRSKPGVAAFLVNLEKEVLRLERELKTGQYCPGRYTEIEIFDPKHRIVSAAPFRDRVAHHAFCAVCEPIFERGFIYDSYANRKGKGTHRAIARYETFRDRFRYVLRCDLYRYFPAIDHCGVCATAGDRAILHARKWSQGCVRGSRMPIMPIHGGCAMRSFGAGGLIRFGSLIVPPERVLRGGSWNNKPRNLRSANRNRNTTENRNNNNGFRVIRTLVGQNRRHQGVAGSATGRPGTVMMRWRWCPFCPAPVGKGLVMILIQPDLGILPCTCREGTPPHFTMLTKQQRFCAVTEEQHEPIRGAVCRAANTRWA